MFARDVDPAGAEPNFQLDRGRARMSADRFVPRGSREGERGVYPLPPALAKLPAESEGRLPREVLRQNRRDRILMAALTVFGTKGFVAASVKDLVTEAGVSRETFYREFADKEACLAALYDEVLAWLVEEAREAASGAKDWAAAVLAVCERLVTLLAADSRLARICAVESLLGGPDLMARYDDALAGISAALATGRAECPWGGELPDALEPTLISGAIFMAGRKILTDSDGTSALGSEVAHLILIFYVGKQEAARVVRRGI